jgi:hypothetical protein
MGGSGGGGYFSGPLTPQQLRQQVQEAEEQAKNEAFETSVANLIDGVLADANTRNADAVSAHLDTLRQAIQADIEGTVDIRFGGSVAKHTYVDGISDADALVILNRSELRGMAPREVRAYFADRIRERLPATDVSEGDLAVTVRFADIDVQLIPAIRVGKALRVPEAGGQAWSPHIRPEAFAHRLTSLNQSLGGKLVPTIKLAKAILAARPEEQRLSGYHVESLALQAFGQYPGPRTTRAMLRHFFIQAADLVRRPIRDATGQSLYVDEYLGKAGSLERRIVADGLARIGRTITNADAAQSLTQWADLLGVSQ